LTKNHWLTFRFPLRDSRPDAKPPVQMKIKEAQHFKAATHLVYLPI
jgi:hypothetical protein